MLIKNAALFLLIGIGLMQGGGLVSVLILACAAVLGFDSLFASGEGEASEARDRPTPLSPSFKTPTKTPTGGVGATLGTTTMKRDTFDATPLRDLRLTDTPGIATVGEGKLQAVDLEVSSFVDTPSKLVGQYLLLGGNSQAETKMHAWLVSSGIRTQHATKVVEAVAAKASRISMY
eukprot:CAMPEP_0180134352 /NCGR_PEP_ID=MMETSP0986-20121125/10108_1 /TAXON_ID=697907 /ORGANISM="non described non described, Strain CCMP2293" /LENGTH=175 /DNA_ID=CAMNT_0022074691 /DNA_START=252 /DNA_END=779 /DNA_ORIENTATION=-